MWMDNGDTLTNVSTRCKGSPNESHTCALDKQDGPVVVGWFCQWESGLVNQSCFDCRLTNANAQWGWKGSTSFPPTFKPLAGRNWPLLWARVWYAHLESKFQWRNMNFSGLQWWILSSWLANRKVISQLKRIVEQECASAEWWTDAKAGHSVL